MSKLLKRIIIDTIGVALIIIAVPFSWLPGPGGIPLALIGLGLLAKNNRWAHNLMNNFEVKIRYYSNQAMHADPRLQTALDTIIVAILCLGIYVVYISGGWLRTFAAASITSSLILLLLNRGRGVRLYAKIFRKKP